MGGGGGVGERTDLELRTLVREAAQDGLHVALRSAVAEAIKPLENRIIELQHDLDQHLHDPYAHPNADIDMRGHLQQLWDERNETRGMIRIIAYSLPAVGFLGPSFAVLIAWFLHR